MAEEGHRPRQIAPPRREGEQGGLGGDVRCYGVPRGGGPRDDIAPEDRSDKGGCGIGDRRSGKADAKDAERLERIEEVLDRLSEMSDERIILVEGPEDIR